MRLVATCRGTSWEWIIRKRDKRNLSSCKTTSEWRWTLSLKTSTQTTCLCRCHLKRWRIRVWSNSWIWLRRARVEKDVCMVTTSKTPLQRRWTMGEPFHRHCLSQPTWFPNPKNKQPPKANSLKCSSLHRLWRRFKWVHLRRNSEHPIRHQTRTRESKHGWESRTKKWWAKRSCSASWSSTTCPRCQPIHPFSTRQASPLMETTQYSFKTRLPRLPGHRRREASFSHQFRSQGLLLPILKQEMPGWWNRATSSNSQWPPKVKLITARWTRREKWTSWKGRTLLSRSTWVDQIKRSVSCLTKIECPKKLTKSSWPHRKKLSRRPGISKPWSTSRGI